MKVVLISLGARTKEHGPHLLLKNDYQMAEYLKEQVAKQVSVAILPTIHMVIIPPF
jgi:creatinine amidohydrolase/Fe(II)-dependent formamide hydrolase-like protein